MLSLTWQFAIARLCKGNFGDEILGTTSKLQTCFQNPIDNILEVVHADDVVHAADNHDVTNIDAENEIVVEHLDVSEHEEQNPVQVETSNSSLQFEQVLAPCQLSKRQGWLILWVEEIIFIISKRCAYEWSLISSAYDLGTYMNISIYKLIKWGLLKGIP